MQILNKTHKMSEGFHLLIFKKFKLLILIILFSNSLFSQNFYVNKVAINNLSASEAKFKLFMESSFEGTGEIFITYIETGALSKFNRKKIKALRLPPGFEKNNSNPSNYTLVRLYFISQFSYGFYEYEYLHDSINVKVRKDEVNYGSGGNVRKWLFPFNQYKSELDIIDNARVNDPDNPGRFCCGKDDFTWFDLNQDDCDRRECKIYKELHSMSPRVYK